MKTIKITDYNTVNIHEVKDNTVIFSWDNGKKHRARVRQDSTGRKFFNSYNLQIALEAAETKYYIAVYAGNGIECTRIFENTKNDYKPFSSKREAQAYIDSGELDEYVYYPSRIIYTKIITEQEREQYRPDYRALWLPVNKYPNGPHGRNKI